MPPVEATQDPKLFHYTWGGNPFKQVFSFGTKWGKPEKAKNVGYCGEGTTLTHELNEETNKKYPVCHLSGSYEGGSEYKGY